MKKKIRLLNDVIAAGEGITGYWFSLHFKRSLADKKAAEINAAFKAAKSTAKAYVEFARNYNQRGIPYGVYISGLKDKEYYKIEEYIEKHGGKI